MTSLLDRSPAQETIHDDVLKAVAASDNGKVVMLFLFDKYNDRVKITEPVLCAAVGNEKQGIDLLRILLDRRRNESQVTAFAVETAARNTTYGRELFELMLRKALGHIPITHAAVDGILMNFPQGERILHLLLDREQDLPAVTPERAAFLLGAHQLELVLPILLLQGNRLRPSWRAEPGPVEVGYYPPAVAAAEASRETNKLPTAHPEKMVRGHLVDVPYAEQYSDVASVWAATEVIDGFLTQAKDATAFVESILYHASCRAAVEAMRPHPKLTFSAGSWGSSAAECVEILVLHHRELLVAAINRMSVRLHIDRAVNINSYKFIKLVLSVKGDQILSFKDAYGWTVLFYATAAGHDHVVDTLVEAGSTLAIRMRTDSFPTRLRRGRVMNICANASFRHGMIDTGRLSWRSAVNVGLDVIYHGRP
ncbi:hypothetical protein BDW74DRAFT_182817 [Aspergillus multicolor]|uniref:uncharacterized protein n=1 Tax=Aspergillus multicolor TaxID=41759 RepID=UPI003CCCCAA7